MERKHYVYIIECRDGSLYTGWTPRLSERIRAHNEGKGAKYTKGRGPVKLVYYEQFETKEEALRREYAIKRLTRQKKKELLQADSNLFRQGMAQEGGSPSWHGSDEAVHHDQMAGASSHNKQMKNFMGTEPGVSGVEQRKLQRVNDAAHGVNNTAGQKPEESGGGQAVNESGKGQHADPSHGDIQK